MIEFQVWEMVPLDPKFQRNGCYFMVKLVDNKVVGYCQRPGTNGFYQPQLDVYSVPMTQHHSDIEWVNQNRERFTILAVSVDMGWGKLAEWRKPDDEGV